MVYFTMLLTHALCPQIEWKGPTHTRQRTAACLSVLRRRFCSGFSSYGRCLNFRLVASPSPALFTFHPEAWLRDSARGILRLNWHTEPTPVVQSRVAHDCMNDRWMSPLTSVRLRHTKYPRILVQAPISSR
jgi:hypothetical protein